MQRRHGLHGGRAEALPLVEALRAVEPAITGLYVQLDLDILDIDVARVNVYSAAGGLDADDLEALLAALLRSFPVRALALTCYDPSCDADGRVPPIALRLLRSLAARLGSP